MRETVDVDSVESDVSFIHSPETRRIRSTILGVLLLHSLLSVSSLAADEKIDWKARFETEYEEAANFLEAGAWEIQFGSKKTMYNDEKDQIWLLTQFTDGKQHRFESVRKHVLENNEDMTVIQLLTPQKHFRAFRQGTKGSFTLTDTHNQPRNSALNSIRLGHPLAFGSHSIFELQLLDLIHHERFEITKVEELKKGRGTQVKYHWQIPRFLSGIPDKNSTTGGWFTLSPNEHWMLQEQFYCFRLDQKPNEGFLFVMKYEDFPNQRIPVAVEQTRFFLSDEGKKLQERTELTDWIEASPPESMFNLSSLGLDEPLPGK
ncbi:MAG: hypothetical protein KDA65_13215 [Planctomycetaceae bacterium]|nr:hypothetical protein [Planctomycetaceae bacterium]